jgi:hypothetical protein
MNINWLLSTDTVCPINDSEDDSEYNICAYCGLEIERVREDDGSWPAVWWHCNSVITDIMHKATPAGTFRAILWRLYNNMGGGGVYG